MAIDNKDIAGISLQRLGQGLNTHIEQGSLLAKGQESVDGQVMQFSSLMSVMNDDVVVMNSMQQDYAPQINETPVLDLREYTPLDEEEAIQDTEDMVFDDLMVLDSPDSMLDVDEIVFSDIVPLVVADLEAVEEWNFEFDGLLKFEVPTPSTTPIPVQVEWIPPTTEVANTSLVVGNDLSPVIPSFGQDVLQVQTLDMVPQVVADEVVQLLNQMQIEVLDQADDVVLDDDVENAPKLFNRNGLVFESAEEVLNTEVDLESVWKDSKAEVIRTAFVEHSDVDLQPELPTSNPVQNSAINPVTVAIQNASSTNTQMSGQTSAGEMNNTLQSINNDIEKSKYKGPATKLEQPKKNFAQLLAQSEEEQAEKMSFNNKLLRRLEMIINDPAGRLDIEIAQDPIGIQVKALVPNEVLPSLEGLEQDIQVALQQQGIDLSSFELHQHNEEAKKYSLNESLDEQLAMDEEEVRISLSNGGMLINKRV